MYKHFENIKYLYGDDIYVQIPNDIFELLSSNIKNKNGSTNIQQSSFAYSYIVLIAFLYKYAHFVDIDNNTYIQNADIKELLGYSRTTKSIDSIIKKDGILDIIGLTMTTKYYPVRFIINKNETINNIPFRDFIMNDDLSEDENLIIKKIVKNRNYEIKEPRFMFDYNGDMGTLYNYSNTHRITINEVLTFLKDKELDNIDFYIYAFIKSKCKGYKYNTKSIRLKTIISSLGISKDAFYIHLETLKGKEYLSVNHRGWVAKSDSQLDSNEYCFKGC